MATVEEIWNALLDFKQSRKIIYAYSEGYSQGAYYLASVADRIYLNPTGSVDFKGLHAELMFFKGTLDKLEIEPQIIRHGKYKSAVEPFLLDKMSPENREQMNDMVSALWSNTVSNIAVARKLSVDQVQKLQTNMPAEMRMAHWHQGWLTRFLYYDQVLSDFRKVTGQNEKTMCGSSPFENMTKLLWRRKRNGAIRKLPWFMLPEILWSGKGQEDEIVPTNSQPLSARPDWILRSKLLFCVWIHPVEVLLASDVIWRETVLARQAKPLIVFHGRLCRIRIIFPVLPIQSLRSQIQLQEA